MKVEKTEFKDLIVLIPQVFGDERGYFFESYQKEKFVGLTGLNIDFVQDNESKSLRDVLRGLHYQLPPMAQDKLVRVTQGSVLDVVVDLRKSQPTYGQHFSVILDGIDKKMLFVPKGFAHGFLTLEDNTIFSYKCSAAYSKEHEGSIHYADPVLKISWEIDDPLVSNKDQVAEAFEDFKSPF